MDFDHWYLIVGVLLILMLVAERRIKVLPVTTSMLYLLLGWLFGRLGWIDFQPISSAAVLERLAEVAVIVSLFCAGLKLRLPLRSTLWRLPAVLATLSMLISVGLLTCVGYWWLGLPLGGAVLLGAILAPTDPVLASDVQVEHARDTDRVRFTLTGEAGLNDGTAFPVVMLGLALLHEPAGFSWVWKWLAVDLVWAVGAGLVTGSIIGFGMGRMIVHLRRTHREAVDLDDFLALGVIALAYGIAHEIHAYGFLSVFAAGLSLRKVERDLSPDHASADALDSSGRPKEFATHPEHAPAYMAEAVLHFTGQLERVGELTLVLLVGAILAMVPITSTSVAIAAALLIVVRPVSVVPVAYAFGMGRRQSALVSWFGIRGIGSVYYLFYALERGMADSIAEQLLAITAATIGISIACHGFSSTPLMRAYRNSAK